MGKLLHILAASVGGGLVLGASIRLGEAIGSSATKTQRREPGPDVLSRARRQPGSNQASSNHASSNQASSNQAIDPLLADRLDRLEEKLARVRSTDTVPAAGSGVEWQTALAGIVDRMDRQQTDVETMRIQVAKATRAIDSVSGMTEQIRHDLHEQLKKELDQRLSAIEASFQISIDSANRETMDAVVASIETRISPRIVKLETNIAGQSAAVAELRDCALQSERSIQRLLGVLERVVNPAGRGGSGSSSSQQAGLATAGKPDTDERANSGGEARHAAPRAFNPVI